MIARRGARYTARPANIVFGGFFMKTLGLALGSGGARGAAHLGLLQALEEENIRPDFITGCSMGAVVGGGYAAGVTVGDLLATVRELKASDLLDLDGLTTFTKLGIFKGNKIRKILMSKIGDVTFDKLKIPFSCVAVDILSGKLVELNSGEVAEAVRASSAIPTVFRPVELNGMMLVDGGTLCRVPVRQCKNMGADVVVAFDVLANTGESVDKVPNVFLKILRVYDIMDYHRTEIAKRDNKDCYDLWLAPALEGLSQYEVKDAEKAYELGYEYAKQHVGDILSLLKDF